MTGAAALLSAAALMLAQATPQFGPADPRIRLVTYNANQVIVLPVSVGYAAVISLGSDERIESIVVGNSADWQVTASKRGDDVVVKPLPGASPTNMVIVTGSRHFVFQLQPAGSDGGAPYVLRFVYPEVVPVQVGAVAETATFRFSGAKSLIPAAMGDDGVRTRIRWNSSTQLPAIFAVERDGSEAIVNGRMDGDTFVVERIARRFVFRLGAARTIAKRRLASAGR